MSLEADLCRDNGVLVDLDSCGLPELLPVQFAVALVVYTQRM
jgi:hypothetical protein